jgi:hypothetical protein
LKGAGFIEKRFPGCGILFGCLLFVQGVLKPNPDKPEKVPKMSKVNQSA